MKTTVAAIDFGTSKIVTLVAENSGSQRCDIIGAGIASYDGFMDGEWNNREELNAAIAASIAEASNQAHRPIKEINVGVPGALSRVYAIESRVDLKGTDPHVTLQDIKAVFKQATEELGKIRGVVVHRSPAWFMVDDGKKTLEPIGMKGRELRALVSFVVADQFFLDEISSRMNDMGILISGFFSTPTGEAMLYLPEEDRDRTSILIDVGYLNTEVMAVEGDALIFHETIPMGGGHMAADLAMGLEIPLSAAEQIKRSYVYGMAAVNQQYEISAGEDGKPASFTPDQVSRVLEPRVEEIAEAISKCISESGVKLGSWSTIYLTGGGLSLNRGGKDYLAGKLDRPVRDIPKRTMKLSSPIYSSSLGLMDLIIDTIEQKHLPTPGVLGGVKDFFRSLFGG